MERISGKEDSLQSLVELSLSQGAKTLLWSSGCQIKRHLQPFQIKQRQRIAGDSTEKRSSRLLCTQLAHSFHFKLDAISACTWKPVPVKTLLPIQLVEIEEAAATKQISLKQTVQRSSKSCRRTDDSVLKHILAGNFSLSDKEMVTSYPGNRGSITRLEIQGMRWAIKPGNDVNKKQFPDRCWRWHLRFHPRS